MGMIKKALKKDTDGKWVDFTPDYVAPTLYGEGMTDMADKNPKDAIVWLNNGEIYFFDSFGIPEKITEEDAAKYEAL